MPSDMPFRPKSLQILLALSKGPKWLQEIQEAVGGSNGTIVECLKELARSGLVFEEPLGREQYGKKPSTPSNRRWFSITSKGKEVIQLMLRLDLIKVPALEKDRQKWLILVLDSLNIVVAKTRLMKILFLLRHETGRWKGSFFKYKAWNYGPYSEQVDKDVEDLQRHNLVSVKTSTFHRQEFSERQSVCYSYTLTAKGKTLAPELILECPPNSIRKIEKIHPFNSMPLLELLKYVYERYPEFISNSKIVEKVLGNRKDEW